MVAQVLMGLVSSLLVPKTDQLLKRIDHTYPDRVHQANQP
ncbi:unnamed protein product [Fructobacillus tropaeoli]|nr:unnamed protein product [Fructobacillus tropaeoli]